MKTNGSKAAPKKSADDSDEESDSSEEDSEDDSDEESDEESDSSEGEEKPAKPAKSKVNGSKPAAESSDEDEDEDDSDQDKEDDEDSDSEEEEKETAQPARSKINGTKPTATEDSSEEGEDSSEDDSSEEEDSSEDDEEEEEEEEEKAEPAVGTQKRKEAPTSAPETPAKRTKPDTQNTTGSTSIFVGNLSWNIDQDWLADIFSSVGGVVSARIITDRETSRPKGFGYVDFETPEQAQKALELKDTEVDGRRINVDLAAQRSNENTPRGGAGDRAARFGDKISEASATLFVGNLNFNTTQDGLWELFGSNGTEVQSVRIPTDKESGQPKGYSPFSLLKVLTEASPTLNFRM